MFQAKWWWFLFPVPMGLLIYLGTIGGSILLFPIGLYFYFDRRTPSDWPFLLLWLLLMSLTVLGFFKPSRAAFAALCLLLLLNFAGILLLVIGAVADLR